MILLDKGAFVDPLTPVSLSLCVDIYILDFYILVIILPYSAYWYCSQIHYTPLHIACFLRDVELVQLLIARNAMINSKALVSVFSGMLTTCLRFILCMFFISIFMQRCETPLMAAVSSGSVDVVKYLLNQVADVGTSRVCCVSCIHGML